MQAPCYLIMGDSSLIKDFSTIVSGFNSSNYLSFGFNFKALSVLDSYAIGTSTIYLFIKGFDNCNFFIFFFSSFFSSFNLFSV